MEVSLLDDVGALIIEFKTGIFYTQQVGGIACLHPMVEGFCIPIKMNEEWEEFGEKTCQVGCMGSDLNGLVQDDLPFNIICGKPIRLDKDRLDKGTEAFIPVVWDSLKGWIMLPNNCD